MTRTRMGCIHLLIGLIIATAAAFAKADDSQGSSVDAYQYPLQPVFETLFVVIENAAPLLGAILIVLSIGLGIITRSLSAFLSSLIAALLLMVMPKFMRYVMDLPAEPNHYFSEDGGEPIRVILSLSAVVAFWIIIYWTVFRDTENGASLTEPLRTGTIAPPSVDELREHQQQSTENEPMTTSSSSEELKLEKEEADKPKPGKRKIILD